MDDQACPRCKTTKYRNPSLKLMVNICGHALCESCVDLLFLKGSGSCPDCNVPLRRSNFRVQLFEDSMVEKEMDIRKRVLKDFNKKEEDFSTLREYNDYLEEIEVIIYNLVNNIDVVGTNKRIEQYKRDNKELIMKNKAKIGREEIELEEILEIEKQMEELRRQEIAKMEDEAKKQKIRAKEALIDELMFADGDAKDILNTFAQTVANKQEEVVPLLPKVTQFSSGVKFTRGSSQAIPIIEEGPLYKYEPLEIPDRCGPDPPSLEEIMNNGFLHHVRAENETEKAGGYTSTLPCLRALQDALSGLYHAS
ncbi:CDK-activating kinase assembly factor MAT1 [Danaus plexippus]|uniref:CDK-activating kinase assembly factor MAT1 n=1 Tax=Danaus plexippus plexippus TaxID=278856 RepID=A0A212EZP9_DANPL|nr:CDK-activating kinase assembly factor MAT1 [Danaus plexippus]OWR46937.1 CDK-activating kinase assembly factor MAT1 isoform 2 [Danaus plexippus plexippus]